MMKCATAKRSGKLNSSRPYLYSVIGLLVMSLWAMQVARAASGFAEQVAPASWASALTPEALPALKYPSFDDTLDKARDQMFAGRYRLALQTVRSAKSRTPGDVQHIQATCLITLGRYQQALAVTSKPATAPLMLDRAEVLAKLGRSAEAIAVVRLLLKDHPDSIQGHLRLGQLLEHQGDFDVARLAYRWFVDPSHNYLQMCRGNRIEKFTDAADTTAVGEALDHWATLDGQYQQDPGLHDTILNIFVKVYDEIDRDYWPARMAAAEFYQNHDDSQHAEQELAAVLNLNPNAAAAYVLAGRISVDGYDFDRADAAVAALRQINPNSTSADLLQTRNLLQQHLPKEANALAANVLKELPNNLEAMSLRAAGEALQLHNAAAQSLLDKIDRARPREAAAYFEVAQQLGADRQYPRSEAMYKIAIQRAPWWTAPRNGLGLLYTQSGDENAARVTLEAAHTLDPFNVDTTNYLRLLDSLATFAKVETPHFILRYDAKRDPLIPEYYPQYLEKNYKAVTSEYHIYPKPKTIIEVFPTHDAFSVRTTGAPWIGTVGACTGRVIAMVSPRKGDNTMGTYNWSQVLRHEFTHTVTLYATDNRISHWMTEGLAVMQEHAPLQWSWVPMLYYSVEHHKLFAMDQLDWAFIRPKKPMDRQLAYAESLWACKYIRQRWGFDAILKMLASYKAGGLQVDVFPQVLGENESEFFDGFQKWCQARVARWGYGPADQAKYDQLREQGHELIAQQDYPQAVKVWEQIAALRPVDELPQSRLAGLYLTPAVNEPLKAIAHLKILHVVDLKDDRFAKRISRIYLDNGELPQAREWALKAIYIAPYDPDTHTLMLDICQKMHDTAGIAREKRVMTELAAWQQRTSQ